MNINKLQLHCTSPAGSKDQQVAEVLRAKGCIANLSNCCVRAQTQQFIFTFGLGTLFPFSALTLLAGCQEEHPACKT